MARIHHLDCATLCTVAPRLLAGPGHAGLVCHVLLVETDDGLTLVDTGLGTADIREPHARLGRVFTSLARPILDESQTALRQVERLGYRAEDVRHLVMTHLDLDHAGGMSDFPKAKVHCTMQEHEAAFLSSDLLERRRYRQKQWAHWPEFELYRARGASWFGFDAIDLRGLPKDVRLVPLFGHTRGHAGVAVRGTNGWVLHAGDAYFHRGMVDSKTPVPPAIRLVGRAMDIDTPARRANRDRLRDLARAGEVRVFCAHDPVELGALAGSAAAAAAI